MISLEKKLFLGENHSEYNPALLLTQSFLVESIGNADESTISKYVKNLLQELDCKENPARQLGLL